MSSVEALIEAIRQFEGTMLFVSHDRTFIDAVCTHVFVMLPSGRSMLFEGNLQDYQNHAARLGFPNVLEADQGVTTIENNSESKELKPSKASHGEVKEIKRKRSSFQKKMTKLEEQEETLKSKRQLLESEMLEIAPTDYDKMNKIQKEIESIDESLSQGEIEWLEASEELESVEKILSDMGRQ